MLAGGITPARAQAPRTVIQTPITKAADVLAISPGGSLVAAYPAFPGPADPIVLWDLTTRTRQLELPVDAPVRRLEFAANGYLLVGSRVESIDVWNLSTETSFRYRRNLDALYNDRDTGPDEVIAAAFSARSPWLAWSGRQDGEPYVAAGASGTTRWTIPVAGRALAIDDAGARLAIATFSSILVYDLETGRQALAIDHAARGSLPDLRMSPGSELLLVLEDFGKEVVVFDATTGELLGARPLQPLGSRIGFLGLPGVLAVADADGSVVSWNPREASTKPLLGPSADQTGGTSLAANAATGTFVVARDFYTTPTSLTLHRGTDGLDLGEVQARQTSPCHALRDRARDVIYLVSSAETDGRSNVLELDLAEGEVRRLDSGWIRWPELGVHDGRFVSLKADGRPSLVRREGDRLLDERFLEFATPDADFGFWQVGASPDLRVVAAEHDEKIYVTDVDQDRVAWVLDRRTDSFDGELGRGARVFLDADAGELALIDTIGNIESWNYRDGALLSRVASPWAISQVWADQSSVLQIGLVSGGDLMVIATEAGVFAVDPKSKDVRWTMVDAGAPASGPSGSAAPEPDANARPRGPLTHATWSDDRGRLAVATDRDVVVLDVSSGVTLARFADSTAPLFLRNADRLIASTHDGGVRLLDVARAEVVVTLALSGPDDDAVWFTPDGYYKATRGAVGTVAYRDGFRMHPFEPFDADRNRPDLVLARIGLAPPERIETYARLRAARLRRLGQSPATADARVGADHVGDREGDREPTTSIGREAREVDPDRAASPAPWVAFDSLLPLVHDAATLTLPIVARGPDPIATVLAYVNDVPVRGRGGVPVADLDRDEGGAGGDFRHGLEVALRPGPNRVEVQVVDVRGRRSTRVGQVVFSTAEDEGRAIWLLGLGVSRYQDSALDLRYAAKDARDVAACFRELAGGRFHATVHTDDEVVRDRIPEWRRFLEEAAPNDLVIVHVAGHGFRASDDRYFMATHDIDAEHPEVRGIAFEELEDLLDGLAALDKLLLLDTCLAGDVDLGAGRATTASGVTVRSARPEYDPTAEARPAVEPGLRLEDVFADLRDGTGAMILAAAGGADYAYEADTWQNGVFTYALLEGLTHKSADRNGDQVLLLSELRRHVGDRVLDLTGGGQRPTTKRENPSFDVPMAEAREPETSVLWPEGWVEVDGARLSPAGDRLAVWSRSELRVVDLTSERERCRIAAADDLGGFADAEFSGDGSFVLAWSTKGRFVGLEVDTGRASPCDQGGPSLATTCRPIGVPGRPELLAMADDGRLVRIVAANGAVAATALTAAPLRWAGALAVNDGQIVATAADRAVRYDLASGEERSAWSRPGTDPGSWDAFRKFALSTSGRYLTVSSDDNRAVVYDLRSALEVARVDVDGEEVVLATDDGPLDLFVNREGLGFFEAPPRRLRVVDLETRATLLARDLESHLAAPMLADQEVPRVARTFLPPRGDLFVLGTELDRTLSAFSLGAGRRPLDPGLRVYSLRDGRCVDWLVRPADTGDLLVFSPDGGVLYAVGTRGTIHRWTLRDS